MHDEPSDDALWDAFHAQTLPASAWTHRAHVRMAFLYLRRHALDEAHVLLRVGIIRLNAAHGLVETPTRGYHETLTRAWLAIVRELARGAEADSSGFIDAHATQLVSDAPLRHYTRERILSLEARARFVEPDLAPFHDGAAPRWRWPLARRANSLPEAQAAGAFGVVRRHDVHTGVDLYAEEDAPTYAVEDGVVVAVEDFTGARADSPWWHDTQAVLVEGASGVVLYGELTTELREGARVRRGDVIGRVRRVLRHDKGRPTTMLHVELYAYGTRASVWWRHGEPRPAALRDPTTLLREADEPGAS